MMLDDKDLKQEILNSVNDDDIPNFSTAIKAKYLAKHEKQTKPWYKSGKVWAFSSSLLACGVIAAIVVPTFILKPEPTPVGPTPVTIEGKSNEIAFGVMSVSNLIPDAKNGPNLFRSQRLSEDKFESMMSELNSYMGIAESMITNNLDMNPIMIESDDPNYPYLMQINNFGEILNFYYKEANENKPVNRYSNESDDDDDDENDELDDDNDENEDEEQEYSYIGLLKKDNITYPVDLKKELENDEYELSLTIQLGESSYIAIEQEFEKGEQSYAYKFIENGHETIGAELSFESENNETIVEIELLKAGNESTYSIKKEGTLFVADYEIDDYDEGNIEISIIENGDHSSYIYKDKELGYSVTFKRN